MIDLQLSRLLIASLVSGQLLYLIVQMGSIYEYGAEIRMAPKNIKGMPKEVKKFWLGWRVPRLNVGNFFYLHRGIPLAALSVLLTNTASLIIEVRLAQ